MTKEEILGTGKEVWDFSHDRTVVIERDDALVAMDEYAKQQAIAFFKWNCKQVDHCLSYLKRVHEADRTQEKDQELDRFENATIEQGYMLFIEQTKSPG